MGSLHFLKAVKGRWAAGCFLGIELPPSISDARSLINATEEATCAYILNPAAFHAQSDRATEVLHKIIEYIRDHIIVHIPIILDGEFGGNRQTCERWAEYAFNRLGVDAVTISGAWGRAAAHPFLQDPRKGVFVLCRTSERSASILDRGVALRAHEQGDMEAFQQGKTPKSVPGYLYLAYQFALEWNAASNCGLILGATHPKALVRVRRMVGDMPILAPCNERNVDLKKAMRAGMNSAGQGLIFSLSYAYHGLPETRETGLRLTALINAARRRA